MLKLLQKLFNRPKPSELTPEFQEFVRRRARLVCREEVDPVPFEVLVEEYEATHGKSPYLKDQKRERRKFRVARKSVV